MRSLVEPGAHQLVRLADQQVPGSWLSPSPPLPSPMVTCAAVLSICVGAVDVDTVPHTCTTSILPTSP